VVTKIFSITKMTIVWTSQPYMGMG